MKLILYVKLKKIKQKYKPGTVVHTIHSPSTQKADISGSLLIQPGSYRKIEDSQGSIVRFSKITTLTTIIIYSLKTSLYKFLGIMIIHQGGHL